MQLSVNKTIKDVIKPWIKCRLSNLFRDWMKPDLMHLYQIRYYPVICADWLQYPVCNVISYSTFFFEWNSEQLTQFFHVPLIYLLDE